MGDSKLIIKQVNDEYKVKYDKPIPMVGFLLHIPTQEKKIPLFVEHLQKPTYDLPKSCLVCEVVSPFSPWYEPIFNYL